jgi:chromosome segregation ATPase
MLTLEQVRALEARVEKAVSLIASLRTENASLRTGLADAEKRVAELEGLVQDFQKDQERIEEGILEALRKLDAFEDAVQAGAVQTGAAQQANAHAAVKNSRVAEPASEEPPKEPLEAPQEALEADADLDIF